MPAQTAAEHLPNDRHALIVDADPMSREMYRLVLEDCGFRVQDTDSGVGAVSLARDAVPDVILLDMQLRDVSGRQALNWLRSNSALQSTAIITLGYAAPGDPQTGAGEGRQLSLRKPVSRTALRALIDGIVRQGQKSTH